MTPFMVTRYLNKLIMNILFYGTCVLFVIILGTHFEKGMCKWYPQKMVHVNRMKPALGPSQSEIDSRPKPDENPRNQSIRLSTR